MGRLKLKIKRLESTSNRQVTYSKRRNGILKKAKELSTLCDIDIVLLMFSPTGRPAIFQGENSNFEEVITKFAHLTPYERARRKRETLEALTKAFKKVDHDVNILNSSSSDQTNEFRFDDEQFHHWQDLRGQQISLQEQITVLQRSLSYYRNPNKINDLNYLTQMENRLGESMNRLRIHKESFGDHSMMPLTCNNQFQNETSFPLIVDGAQEARSMPWILDDENQQFVTIEPDFLLHGDVQYAAEASLPGCSGYFGNNELRTGSGSRADCVEQYTFPCLGTGFSEYVNLQPGIETRSVDYQVNSDFELPMSLYGNSGPSDPALYHQHARMSN